MRLLLLVLILISSLSCRKFVWDNPNDTIISTTEPASLKNGLVAFYPFNGNASDRSGNSFNGIVQGALLTTDRFNIPEKAYSFNHIEKQFIDLSANNFNLTGNFSRTIACWIYPTQEGNFISTGNGVREFSTANMGTSFNLRIITLPGLPNAYNLSFMGWGDDIDTRNEPAIFYEKWVHVAVTYSNNTISLFVNGIKGVSKNTVLKTFGNSNFIGKSNHVDFEAYYNGKVDEVRIYNRALTQEEITYLANN